VQQELKQRIIDAVTAFEQDQMSVRPQSVTVDLEPDCLVVVARGVTCPAEQDFAQERARRALLEQFYSALFETTRGTLERAVQNIVGRSVRRSGLNLDPASGNAVIVFELE
jgi:uncharacterized protein YbcI